MRRYLLAFISVCCICTLHAQSFNPNNPPIRCGYDSTAQTTSLDDIVGTYKILWVVCTADSACLPQDWPIHGTHGDTLGHSRVMNPSTYRMPSWAHMVFDSLDPNSLCRYYKDQSGGRFTVTGTVVADTDSTVFRCDTSISKRPVHDETQTGRRDFFLNIMAKVDRQVNFADYLLRPNSRYAGYIIFDIYGLSENCQAEEGGVSQLAAEYPTADTNSLGQQISVLMGTGCTFWSNSEQALSMHDDCPNVGAADSVMAAYWNTLGLAAHEFGHLLSLGHTFGDIAFDSSPENNTGYGSFDIMGYSPSFPDPANNWATGGVSPYNPYSRYHLGWIAPTVVNQPQFGYVLQDNIMSDACLKIPAYRRSQADSDQYFLAVAVTRQSPWDRLWPRDGLMICHVDPTASNGNRRGKQFDLELSSGLFNWTLREEPIDSCWDSYLDSLWTGENTLEPNDSTGVDSLDFWWWHTNHCPAQAFFGGPAAPISAFYEVGDSFNFASNPSSDAQTRGPAFAQNLPTMASMRVLSIDHDGHTVTLNAWSRHWSGTVTTNAIWTDSVVVDNDLTIWSGATLTINPGTKVAVAPGKTITIEGRIVANGTASHPIVFDHSQVLGLWNGIAIRYSTAENSISYATVRNAEDGIIVYRANAAISHVTLENCGRGGIGFAYATGSLSFSTLQNDSVRGALIFNSNISVHDNNFIGNGVYGLRMWGCEQITLSNNTFTNNGRLHRPDYAYWPGLEVLEGSVNLQCNTFTHNAGPGLVLLPTAYADMGSSARNVFTDNMQAMNDLGFDYGEVNLDGGTLAMYCGENTLKDSLNAHRLMWSEYEIMPPEEWNFGVNWWGITDTATIHTRMPSGILVTPVLSASVACSAPPPSNCVITPDYLLFKQGWDQEREAQFADAVITYEAYLTQYPGGKYEAVVTDRLLVCKSAIGWEWSDIRKYFNNLAADSSKDSSLVTLCKSNAAWCLAEEGDYINACVELDTLLDHTDKDYDRLALSIKRLMAEVAQDDSVFDMRAPSPGGNRHGAGSGHTDQMTANETFGDHLARVEHRVDSVLAVYAHHGRVSHEQTIILPTKYALYQNYPNPFNPTTEIRFDLPEAARVELKIFNTLGQLVTTLVDEARPAGAYRISWDGHDVAAGMYIYQLKAGTFTDAKKMVLIK